MPSPLNIAAEFHEESNQLDRFLHVPRGSTGSRIGAVVKQQPYHWKFRWPCVSEARSRICSGDRAIVKELDHAPGVGFLTGRTQLAHDFGLWFDLFDFGTALRRLGSGHVARRVVSCEGEKKRDSSWGGKDGDRVVAFSPKRATSFRRLKTCSLAGSRRSRL